MRGRVVFEDEISILMGRLIRKLVPSVFVTLPAQRNKKHPSECRVYSNPVDLLAALIALLRSQAGLVHFLHDETEVSYDCDLSNTYPSKIGYHFIHNQVR